MHKTKVLVIAHLNIDKNCLVFILKLEFCPFENDEKGIYNMDTKNKFPFDPRELES